jgi:Dyp-type peroxidase family
MANPLLNATNVSHNDSRFTNLLTNLQGHILKHHGRTHAYHIFIKFNPTKSAGAKNWIKSFATNKITSAIKQLKDSEKRHTNKNFDGGVFRNLSLSHSGYINLGVDVSKIPQSDTAFLGGLKASNTKLSDDINTWEIPFKDTIDALIIVADNNVSKANEDKDKILNAIRSFSTVVHVQKGKILRNAYGIGIEHFGYADGISQPNFFENNDSPATQWDDNGALLSTLLVEDTGTITPDSFGSFYVFRKLEQDVLAFKTTEEKLSETFNKLSKDEFGIFDKNHKHNRELAGAMIVGRFEDGTEVINHSSEKGIVEGHQLNNDFDYRDDAVGSITNGSKCPFHSHIRVTNPRSDVGGFAKTVRLTRRGIPYNDIGRDEFDLDNDQPSGGVGLLFQCYQSSILNQFEFIQKSWSNEGDIGGRPVGQDAIIGQGLNATQKFLPSQWGVNANNQPTPLTFRDFVKMKGGEYFFTPSLSFLKNI